MRCDLESHIVPSSKADVELTVARLDDSLAAKIFDPEDLCSNDRSLLDRRKAIWEAGFGGAYVATDPSGEPVYLQWVVPPSDHQRIRNYWGPLFGDLPPDTALSEGVWIPPKHRGRKIMPEACAMIGRRAVEDMPGAMRYALAFVNTQNQGAINGFRGAGYVPHLVRFERWQAGQRTVNFEPAGSHIPPSG